MRKNRMKKILVMCVIINILFCAEVESVLAYPAQCSISVTRREQQETNWCWAAVSQMIGDTLLWFINTATNSNKCVGGRI